MLKYIHTGLEDAALSLTFARGITILKKVAERSFVAQFFRRRRFYRSRGTALVRSTRKGD